MQRIDLTPEQKDIMSRVDRLRASVVEAYEKGHYAEGIRAGSECLKLQKQLFGDKNPAYATCLNDLA